MSATVRGADKVIANMQKAAVAIEAAVGDAVREAAMLVEREAKINVPVDTGRLRSSIASEEKKPLLFEVGTNVEYAAFVEFGTSKMAAQPYLQPAVETVRAKYPDMIIEDVRVEIR
jgi:HK97 gp10 family phage protein